MKIHPYKSSPISFEAKFDKYHENIYFKLMDIDSSRKSIEDVRILPNWAESINEILVKKLMVQSIKGTLAIEGIFAEDKEIEEVYKGNININEIKNIKLQSQHNIKEVCNFIKKIGKKVSGQPIIITEDIIKSVHKIITNKLYDNDNEPGNYRNFPVEVGERKFGGVYRPPKTLADIRILMAGYVEWLNSNEIINMIPVFRAILAHYYLAIVHPFGDGNGRVARALESLILYNSGFKYGSSFALWKCYYENYEEYFSLLNKTRVDNNGDLTEFIIFVLDLLQKAVDNIRSLIRKMIDHLLFKDYVSYLYSSKQITPRQNSIMNFMLEQSSELTVKELANHPAIMGLYKGSKSKVRLFQMDIKKLIDHFDLLKKARIETKKEEVLILNIEVLPESE